MKKSQMNSLFILGLVLSIINFLQGKVFVPIASYFLIMAAIIRIMRIEENQYKFKEQVIQKLKAEQLEWLHKELNQACESNEIEEIKKTLYSLDHQLYLLLEHAKSLQEEKDNGIKSKSIARSNFLSAEEEMILGYIWRQIRKSQIHGINSAIFFNAKHFKKQRRAYKFLVEHAEELEQEPNVIVKITESSVQIYWKSQ